MATGQRAIRRLFSSRLLLAALILNVSLGLTYVGFWIIAARQDLFWRADFSAFYTGWSIIRDGQGRQLYDPEVQREYQREILAGRSFEGGLLLYVNPPHLTIPFVPLSLLPRSTAFLVWTLGQAALLIWLLRLLYGMARSREPEERWLLLSAVIAFSPLMVTFLIGAFSLWMTVCLLQFYLTIKRGDEGRAGLWLVLGSIKPQAVLLLGVLVLAARRWRTLLSALFSAGMLTMISVTMLGWQIWGDYVHLLRSFTGLFDSLGVVPTDMHNFKGTLALMLGNDQSRLINLLSYTALIAAAGLTLWLWRNRWQPDHPNFELRMALTMLLGLLFSVHLYPQDSLMLIVPTTLFYAYLRQRHLPRRAFAALALSCPVLVFVSESTLGGSLGIRIPVVVMIVLLGWMARALYTAG
jgi:hypothetical protein